MVEGESDEKALPILIRRTVPHPPGVKALNLRGRDNLLNIKRVSAVIEYNCQANRNISKVLLCIDSECTDVAETQKEVAPKEKLLRQSFPQVAPSYLIVDHSLEGWLLQDKEAIQETIGRNSKLPQYGNPEENCRPAELLQEIFEKNGNDYKKTMHAPRLAERLNIETVARASQTFRTFQQAIKG